MTGLREQLINHPIAQLLQRQVDVSECHSSRVGSRSAPRRHATPLATALARES